MAGGGRRRRSGQQLTYPVHQTDSHRLAAGRREMTVDRVEETARVGVACEHRFEVEHRRPALPREGQHALAGRGVGRPLRHAVRHQHDRETNVSLATQPRHSIEVAARLLPLGFQRERRRGRGGGGAGGSLGLLLQDAGNQAQAEELVQRRAFERGGDQPTGHVHPLRQAIGVAAVGVMHAHVHQIVAGEEEQEHQLRVQRQAVVAQVDRLRGDATARAETGVEHGRIEAGL